MRRIVTVTRAGSLKYMERGEGGACLRSASVAAPTGHTSPPFMFFMPISPLPFFPFLFFFFLQQHFLMMQKQQVRTNMAATTAMAMIAQDGTGEQTHKQTNTQTDKHTNTQTNTQTQTDKHTNTQTDKHTNTQTDREIDRKTHKQRGR